MELIEKKTSFNSTTMDFDQEIHLLNQFPRDKLTEELFRCCGCRKWVEEMISSRPFSNLNDFTERANLIWWNSLNEKDWLEAFSAHPKIGDKNALRAKFSHTPNSWEGNEQSGANSASEEVLEGLSVLNVEYENRHGFIFLICATGKSALEMLNALKNRLPNDTATELQNAAGEQAKIIQLRLIKLLNSFKELLSQQQQHSQQQSNPNSKL